MPRSALHPADANVLDVVLRNSKRIRIAAARGGYELELISSSFAACHIVISILLAYVGTATRDPWRVVGTGG